MQNNIRRWSLDARPYPNGGINWVPYYEPGKYDLAVLHLDQQCIDPEIGKGRLFRDLNSVITDIPKIIINHGTPFWPERWDEAGSSSWTAPKEITDAPLAKRLEYQKRFLIEGGITTSKGEKVIVPGVKKMVGNAMMVVNSYTAAKQWEGGIPIWHGLDPDEWWVKTKEPKSCTAISPAGLDYYYNRDLMRNVIETMRTDYGLKHIHIGDPGSWVMTDHPKLPQLGGGFGAYRDMLARMLVYFNPSKESPMPRARTEAMLSGCCVLSCAGQDAEMIFNFNVLPLWKKSSSLKEFIEMIDCILKDKKAVKEVTGMIVPENPRAISVLINHLINNRFQEAMIIGENAREHAKKLFGLKLYHKQWEDVINQALNKGAK